MALPETGALPTVGNGSFTLAAWAKINGSDDYHNILRRDNGLNQGSENRRYIIMWTQRTTGHAAFLVDDGAAAYSSAGVVSRTDNNWHHFVGVYDAVNRKMYLYVDGGLEAGPSTIPATQFNTTREPWVIGAVSPVYSVAQFFLGSIDDVRIYNRALTQTDITALYHNGGPTTIKNAHISRGVIK